MVQSCVIVGCTNRWQKGSKLSWHRIPSEKYEDRRRKWLIAINRTHWLPNNQDRVCGRHFISGCVSQDADNPDYVPSLHMGYPGTTSTPMSKAARYNRIRAWQSLKLETEQDECDRHTVASALMDLSSHLSGPSFHADTEKMQSKELCEQFQQGYTYLITNVNAWLKCNISSEVQTQTDSNNVDTRLKFNLSSEVQTQTDHGITIDDRKTFSVIRKLENRHSKPEAKWTFKKPFTDSTTLLLNSGGDNKEMVHCTGNKFNSNK